MEYKLVAADIDGTLLPKSGVISPRSLEAIARLHERGVVFTLSTGRSVISMRRFLPLVGAETPVIGFNGAVIAKTSGEVLHEQRLVPACTRRILELGRAMGPDLVVWDGDRAYAAEYSADVAWYESFSSVRIELRDWEALAQVPAHKVLWIDSSGDIGQIHEALRREDSTGFDYFPSQRHFLEFVSAGVSKGNALGIIAGLLGITREEVLAVGDGMNDLPMLEYAGLGIAMGNASAQLKAAADIVTGPVEENGLAEAIERFVLSPDV